MLNAECMMCSDKCVLRERATTLLASIDKNKLFVHDLVSAFCFSFMVSILYERVTIIVFCAGFQAVQKD